MVSQTVKDSKAAASDPALKILHKRCEGEDYFLMENTGKNTVKAQIVTGLQAGRLTVLFEKRGVNLKDGAFSDEFTANAVHIYTTAKKLPAPLMPSPSKDKRLEGKNFLKTMRKQTANFRFYNGTARWIWIKSPSGEPIREVSFAKEITLDGPARSAPMLIAADDTYRLFVNGKCVGDAQESRYPAWNVMKRYELAPYLKVGKNILVVQAEDKGSDFCAGLLCELNIVMQNGKSIRVLSDGSWVPDYAVMDKKTAVYIVCPYGSGPWQKNVKISPDK